MRRIIAMLLLLSAVTAFAAEKAAPEHIVVYRETGRFGGWPSDHGIWIWGNEILVGYGRGFYKDLGPTRHAIDRDKPEEHWLARSLDGGATWTHEHPADKGYLIPEGDALHGTEKAGVAIKPTVACPGGIDFTHPDFALTVRMRSTSTGGSRFYYSTDRGHVWEGPFALPMFDQIGIAARTDYVVFGPSECMLFLTASKTNGQEGRPLCVKTVDGGKTWTFVSWIGPEPAGYSIMPGTVRVGENALVTTIRCREGDPSWIDAYASEDRGETWTYLNRPVPSTGEGNPPALIKLRDGRLCLTYGYRAAPFGMRAKLSDDNGKTWGEDIMLREDGSGRDLGYPRSVQREDGKVVTVYYYQDAVAPERYIAATIWQP